MDWSLVGRYLLALVLGYLLGAIPDTYLLTRWFTGKDLRRLGTGNLTMTNTFRSGGSIPAILATLWHAILGFGVVIGASWLFPEVPQSPPEWVVSFGRQLPNGLAWLVPQVRIVPLWAALGAFLGQNWTIFLRGAAGRGRICFTGSMWLLAPLAAITDAPLWVLGYLVSRRPAVGATVANVALPFLMLLFTASWIYFALGWVFAAVFTFQVLRGGHEYSRGGWRGRRNQIEERG